MNTSNTACICILDVESKFRENYYPWFYTILKETDHYNRFDIYACTVDEEAFLKSNLYKMLDELQKLGIVSRIFTIQFALYGNEKLLEMATLCENFREYNQSLYDIRTYAWHFQVTPLVDFDLGMVEKFKLLTGVKLKPNKVYYFTEVDDNEKDPFSFFMTSNRFVFNNLQNLQCFINSDRVQIHKTPKNRDYPIRRLLQRMDVEYLPFEGIK